MKRMIKGEMHMISNNKFKTSKKIMLIFLGSRNILSILTILFTKKICVNQNPKECICSFTESQFSTIKLYQLILMSIKIFTKPFTKEIVSFIFDKMKFEK